MSSRSPASGAVIAILGSLAAPVVRIRTGSAREQQNRVDARFSWALG